MVGRQPQPTLEPLASDTPTPAGNQADQVSCLVTEADIELCLSTPPPQEEQAEGQVVSPDPLEQEHRTSTPNMVYSSVTPQGHWIRRRDNTRPYHLQKSISPDVSPTDQEDHAIKMVRRRYPWIRPVAD